MISYRHLQRPISTYEHTPKYMKCHSSIMTILYPAFSDTDIELHRHFMAPPYPVAWMSMMSKLALK